MISSLKKIIHNDNRHINQILISCQEKKGQRQTFRRVALGKRLFLKKRAILESSMETAPSLII